MAKQTRLTDSISIILRNQGMEDAVMAASGGGKLIDLKILLARGADVTGQLGTNALMNAVRHNASTFVQLLVKHGARDGPLDQIGESPFMLAVSKGSVRCVEALLPYADLDYRTKDGNQDALQVAEDFAPGRGERGELVVKLVRDEQISRRVNAEVEAINQEALPGEAPSTARLRI